MGCFHCTDHAPEPAYINTVPKHTNTNKTYINTPSDENSCQSGEFFDSTYPLNIILNHDIYNFDDNDRIQKGTQITVDEQKGNNMCISKPKQGWYRMFSENDAEIEQQCQLKVNNLQNILQLNDKKLATSLLSDAKWNITEAIETFYNYAKIKVIQNVQYHELWQWQNDDNIWKAYDEQTNQIICEEKIGQVIQIGNHHFIKTSNAFGQQINYSTNQKISIRKISVECVEIWKWQSDDKSWNTYDEKEIDAFCRLKVGAVHYFSNSSTRCVANQSNNINYKFKFNKISQDIGEQIDIVTNEKKACKRVRIKKLLNSGALYPYFWSNDGSFYHDYDDDGENILYYKHSQKIAIETDYMTPQLVDINLNSNMAKQIIESINKTEYEIVDIESVQNKYLWHKYNAAKNRLKKMIGKDKINEKYLWHEMRDNDTSRLMTTYTSGFDSECCFATSPSISDLTMSVNTLLYCKVLCGECHLAAENTKLTDSDWPTKMKNAQLYDSLVNQIDNPTVYIINEKYSMRIYPMFIVRVMICNNNKR